MDVISIIIAVVMVLFFCFVYWGVKNLSIKPPELKDSEKNEPYTVSGKKELLKTRIIKKIFSNFSRRFL